LEWQWNPGGSGTAKEDWDEFLNIAILGIDRVIDELGLPQNASSFPGFLSMLHTAEIGFGAHEEYKIGILDLLLHPHWPPQRRGWNVLIYPCVNTASAKTIRKLTHAVLVFF
jgi:hypothetical protein